MHLSSKSKWYAQSQTILLIIKEHFLQSSPVQELVHLKEELTGRKDIFSPLKTYKNLAEKADIS